MKFFLCFFIIHACIAINASSSPIPPGRVASLAEELLATTDNIINNEDLANMCAALIKDYDIKKKADRRQAIKEKKAGFAVDDEAQSAKVLFKEIIQLSSEKYFLKISKEKVEITNLANLSKEDFGPFKIVEINQILTQKGISFKLARPVASKIIKGKEDEYYGHL